MDNFSFYLSIYSYSLPTGRHEMLRPQKVDQIVRISQYLYRRNIRSIYVLIFGRQLWQTSGAHLWPNIAIYSDHFYSDS